MVADRAPIPRGLEAAGTVGVDGGVECDAGGMAVVTGRCDHGADRQRGKACLEDTGKCRGACFAVRNALEEQRTAT